MEVGPGNLVRQGFKRPRYDTLPASGTVIDHRCQGRRLGAVRDEPARDLGDRGKAHKDDDGLAWLDQRVPVEVRPAVLTVAGHEYAGLGVVAMGERYARIGPAAVGGGDPGHHLERNARVCQYLDFLAPAPEHDRDRRP